MWLSEKVSHVCLHCHLDHKSGYLLHQATLPRHRVKAALPNTLKHTGRLPKRRDKHGPNERIDQILEKELNRMQISSVSDAEFKTLVIRMFKELSEDLKSIEKIQSEMKNTLIEMKNNLQGNNSRVDEAENQINDLGHRKQKPTNQSNRKKKESKKQRIE